MNKVNICSIIYNESILLPFWVESWLSIPWVDRIFLVDSGSTDGSIKIAKNYDNRVSVITVPWRNSFARQRNIAIKLVKSDYFMMPDIDEIPCGKMDGDIECYRCPNGNYHLPYVKFYDWKTLWVFNDDNTPQLLSNQTMRFGCKYTMNIYKKGTISGFVNDLHEAPIWMTNENKCPFLVKTKNLSELKSIFLLGHYDQAKHFLQAKKNNTSVEYEMGLKRARYRLINDATYDGVTYTKEWAERVLKENNVKELEKLGASQLKSFQKQHIILEDFDAFNLNNEVVKKYVPHG